MFKADLEAVADCARSAVQSRWGLVAMVMTSTSVHSLADAVEQHGGSGVSAGRAVVLVSIGAPGGHPTEESLAGGCLS